MKKIVLFICFGIFFLLHSCMVSTRPTHSFLTAEQLKDAEIISVNVPMWITKPIVRKALREDGNEEMIDLIRKFSDVKIMTVSKTNGNFQNSMRDFLDNNRFEEWVTIRKDTEVIKLQAQQSKDAIRKLMFTVSSGDELVLIDIKGKFTPEDISRLIIYSEKKDVKKLIATSKNEE